MMMLKLIFGEAMPQFNDALYVRDQVFTLEQGYPQALDHDEYDAHAWHCVLYANNHPVGTARMFADAASAAYKIGRVAILKDQRGKHLGNQLMLALMDKAKVLGEFPHIALSAQVYAQDFYTKLGFSPLGEEYLEDGAPHILMQLALV